MALSMSASPVCTGSAGVAAEPLAKVSLDGISRREALKRIGGLMGFLLGSPLPALEAVSSTSASVAQAALDLGPLLKAYPALTAFSGFVSSLTSVVRGGLRYEGVDVGLAEFPTEARFNAAMFAMVENLGEWSGSKALPSAQDMKLEDLERYLQFCTPCASALAPRDLRRAAYLATKRPEEKFFVANELGREISDAEHAQWLAWFDTRLQNFNQLLQRDDMRQLVESSFPGVTKEDRDFWGYECMGWRMFDNITTTLIELNEQRHELRDFVTKANARFPQADGTQLLNSLIKMGFDQVVPTAEFALRRDYWHTVRELDFTFANNNEAALRAKLEALRDEMRQQGLRLPRDSQYMTIAQAPLETWLAAKGPGRLVLFVSPESGSIEGWFDSARGASAALSPQQILELKRFLPKEQLQSQRFMRELSVPQRSPEALQEFLLTQLAAAAQE